jgi:hypothetical protein
VGRTSKEFCRKEKGLKRKRKGRGKVKVEKTQTVGAKTSRVPASAS